MEWRRGDRALMLLPFLFVCILSLSNADPGPSQRPLRVAVIGAGIGGASTAYYLRQQFPLAHISVFERSESVLGGRIHSFEWEGHSFEAGAEVFTTFNYLLYQLTTQQLGIPLRGEENPNAESSHDDGTQHDDDEDDDEKNIYIYDGDRPGLRPWPFTERASLYSTVRVMALAHRFKLDLLRNYLARVDHASKVFRTLEEFAEGACSDTLSRTNTSPSHPCHNLRQYLTHSISQFLEHRGIRNEWILSAVTPVRIRMTRVIYDQNADINGFAGLVSLVSADDTRAALHGNRRIVERLLNDSQAQLHLNTSIRELIYSQSLTDVEWRVAGHTFDVVVVATPFPISGDLKCLPSSRETRTDDSDPTGCGIGPVGERVSKVVTYVSSAGLNPHMFGPSATQATNIFTTPLSDVNGVPFFSIGQKWKHSNSSDRAHGKTLFKVFSPKALTPENLHSMFDDPIVVLEQPWPGVFAVLPPLNLSSSPKVAGITGLYYLSAIESVTVAMEGSVLSAHNIARLIRIGHDSAPTNGSDADLGATSPHYSDILSGLSSAGALMLLQSFVAGWLVTYSGFGSLNPSSPAHLLAFFSAHLATLLITHMVDTPLNAMSVEWISTELAAGLLAGLGLSLLRSCSILHAFIHYSQHRSSLLAALVGALLSLCLLIPVGLSASLMEATDVIALASRSYTNDQAWCGLGVASGPIASQSCSFLPPIAFSIPLMIPIVIHLFKHRKSVSIMWRESSRWLCILLGASLPISLLLWESTRQGSPAVTLSAGVAWKGSEESLVRWLVSTCMIVGGAAVCSLLTGRKNMISQGFPHAIHIVTGTSLLCLAVFMSSGFSPSFSLAQISVQLLFLPAASASL